MGIADFWRLLYEAFNEWRADKAGRLAAALAFYAVFALAPLMLLIVGIAARLFGQRAAEGQLMCHTMCGRIGVPSGGSLECGWAGYWIDEGQAHGSGHCPHRHG
jgi:hypothetical protein